MPRFPSLLVCLLLTIALAEDAPEESPAPEVLTKNIIEPVVRRGEIVENIEEEEDKEIVTDPETGRRLYTNYRLVRVTPETKDHLDVLNFIAKGVEDYWTPVPNEVNLKNNVDMLISPIHYDQVTRYLNCSGVPFVVTVEDLQHEIDMERDAVVEEDDLVARQDGCSTKVGYHWGQYHRMDRFYSYMDCLSANHKDKVQLIEIGRSYEGRRLQVVKISRGNNPKKEAIWIDGGIHAREWISPASVMYFLYQFVENYDEHKELLKHFDVYILPVVNPDGYEFTHTHDRMWRKTRSNPSNHNTHSKCVGTDPNRNWGYQWGGEGASTNPCSETYRGPRPFSESETRSVEQFILGRADSIKLFLTYHSYGQYILYPWGYTDRGVPPNWEDLQSLAQVSADAMLRAGGHRYTIGSAAQVLYPAAGGSDDWAKGSANIPYSYTVELPDSGQHGFILPPHKIDTTVKSAFEGLKAMLQELKNRV